MKNSNRVIPYKYRTSEYGGWTHGSEDLKNEFLLVTSNKERTFEHAQNRRNKTRMSVKGQANNEDNFGGESEYKSIDRQMYQRIAGTQP